MDRESTYVVVLRGSSAARFKPGGLLHVNFTSATGLSDVLFRTKYSDEGFSTPVPRELWVEVRGSAPSLQVAIEALADAARTLIPFLAFATNAWIAEPEVELAYDTELARTEHEYFQNFLPDERGMPLRSRWVNAGAVGTLIETVASHPESDHFYRAIAQYYLALLNWSPGRDILATAHLYMGVEALTEVAIQNECRKAGLTKGQLMEKLGLARVGDLGPHFRLSVLFQGDKDCYAKAKDASDGLEHGYKGFPEIRTLAQDARDRTAAYLRSAIIMLSGLNPIHANILLSAPYDSPHHPWMAKYLRGFLQGPAGKLAAEGQAYPIMRWKSSIKDVRVDEAGEYHVTPGDEITASLGKAVTFRPTSVEVWGAPRKLRQ